jgi:hypothetical protein
MLHNNDIRAIPEWPGYSADTDGGIWSGGRKLKTCKTKYGYHQVRLFRPGLPRGRGLYVHRLILETFVGPCPPGMECCHNDDDKDNNRLDNLRWDTRSSNRIDAFRNGRLEGRPRGERIKNHILSEQDIPEIFEMRKTGLSQRAIGRRLGVSQQLISDVLTRKTWAHVALT